MTILFAAGQVLTASQLNLLAPQFAFKATNQQTTTTTLVTDTDLVMTLVANQTFKVEFELYVQQSTALTNFSVTPTLGGTLTLLTSNSRFILGPSGTAANVTSDQNFPIQGRSAGLGAAFYGLGSTTGSTFLVRESLLIASGASGGSVGLQWAEGSATAGPIIVTAGSHMIARAVA